MKTNYLADHATRTLYILVALVVVATVWAHHMKIDISVSARGTVRPQGDVIRVISETGGKIRSLNLQEGASIRRGDVLVQFDTRAVELRMRSLESRIHVAEQRLSTLGRRVKDTAAIEDQAATLEVIDGDANERAVQYALDHAGLRFTRAGELFAAGLISQQALDESHAALSQAQTEKLRLTSRTAELRNAQRQARLRDLDNEALPLRADLSELYHQLELTQLEHDRLTIVSPCDGQLTAIAPLHVSEFVAAGAAIATVVPEHHSLVVEAWIPAAERHFVAAGQIVRLQTDSFPPGEYDRINGTVEFISPDAVFNEARSGAYRVLITPASGEGAPLRLGMTFRTFLITRQERLLWLFFQKVQSQLQ